MEVQTSCPHDHRKQLWELLSGYQTRDQQQLDYLSNLRDFVVNNPDCFRRELIHGHITASAWLLDKTHTKVLLTHHKKLGIWIQLGGHADGNCDVVQVALNEAKEESGIENISLLSDQIFDLDIHEIPQYKDIPCHLHYDIRFIMHASSNNDCKISSESNCLSWIPLSKVTGVTGESSILRLVEKTILFLNKTAF